MTRFHSSLRVCLSAALAVVVATVYGLTSLAAPETDRTSGVESEQPQTCTGILTITGGSVQINGNDAQTGATVLSGNMVATSSNGHAIIDLGALGKLELGNGTTVTVLCVGGMLEVRSKCSKTYVKVRNGKVDVTQPKTQTLLTDQDEKYGDSIDATAAPGTDWLVDCQGKKPLGLYIGSGLAGILALITVGTGVVVGVKTGGPSGEEVPTSPIR
jgi:hypothetical protein